MLFQWILKSSQVLSRVHFFLRIVWACVMSFDDEISENFPSISLLIILDGRRSNQLLYWHRNGISFATLILIPNSTDKRPEKVHNLKEKSWVWNSKRNILKLKWTVDFISISIDVHLPYVCSFTLASANSVRSYLTFHPHSLYAVRIESLHICVSLINTDKNMFGSVQIKSETWKTKWQRAWRQNDKKSLIKSPSEC